MSHPPTAAHTHETDYVVVHAAARSMAANLMYPTSASQALTAALRMIDRLAGAIITLRSEVDALKARP